MASDYVSGQISFAGLGSGTDFQTMIDQLIKVESIHKNQLEYWKESWALKIEALDALNNSIASLRTTLDSMDSVGEFLVKDAESSETDVLSATADDKAEEGSHIIEVHQLAQNSVWMSGNGLSNANGVVTPFGQTFRFYYDDPNDDEGAKSVGIWVPVGTKFDDFINMINTHPDNPGVKASKVSDGHSYYLQLRGMDTGEEADLLVSNGYFGNFTSITETQANQDAKVKVDGWPPAADEYISNSTNTLEDTLAGINMTLKGTGTSQVNVKTNTDSVVENVATFIEKVNEMRTLFKGLTDVEEGEKENKPRGSIMTGNYAVQLVMSNLKSVTAEIAKGFDYYDEKTGKGDKYSTLSQLGILTDADQSSPTNGLLVLDKEKFLEVLNEDPEAVAKVFAAKDEGTQTIESGSFKYYSHVSTVTKPGHYDVSYTVSGGKVTDATVGGVKTKINNNDGTLTVMSGAAKGLVVKVLDTSSDGTFGGSVSLKQGKAGEIADILKEYTNEEDGPMHIVVDNYKDIIQGIDKKILYEEDRLDRRAKELKLKFARLEALLGEYDQIGKSLNSAVAQLQTQ